MAKDQGKQIVAGIPDALLVVCASAVFYFGAYVHELAYVWYFGVPSSLVKVDLEKIIAVGFIPFVGLIVAMLLHIAYLERMAEGRKPIDLDQERWMLLWRVVQLNWIPLLAIFILWIAGGVVKYWGIAVALFAGIILLELLPAIEKPREFWIRLRKELTSNVADEAAKHGARILPRMAVILSASGFAFILLCGFVGIHRASSQTSFGIIANPTRLLLTRFGDVLVFADYDDQTGAVLRSFTLISADALVEPIGITNFSRPPTIEAVK